MNRSSQPPLVTSGLRLVKSKRQSELRSLPAGRKDERTMRSAKQADAALADKTFSAFLSPGGSLSKLAEEITGDDRSGDSFMS